MDSLSRCGWAEHSELERIYHDERWGRPEFDDKELFKMLCLESLQAGLSWLTVLRKMPALRLAFGDFDPEVLVAFDQAKVEDLLEDSEIIRNRRKIEAIIANASAYHGVLENFDSFSSYLWSYVGGQPIVNSWRVAAEVPARSEISAALSIDLKRRGFKFVGPTSVYAFMQAAGMVNDHLLGCAFRSPGSF